MSVLSRPVLHRATAPTQRKASIPLPRTAATSAGAPPAEALPVEASTVPTSTVPSAPTQQPPDRPTRRRGPALAVAGTVVALAVGVGAYAALDGSDPATVIAPAVVNAPSETDIARDRAAELRGGQFQAPSGTEIARDRAAELRGSTARAAVGADAQRLTEAARDAAMQQRQRNAQP